MEQSEYLKIIVEALRPIIKNDVNSGMERSINRYLDMALDAVKRVYQQSNKMTTFSCWTGRHKRDIVHLWEALTPSVVSAVEEILRGFKSKKMMKEIKATSAQAIIKEAMSEAGLKHKFEGQTHRAKVSVLLLPGKALTVYIPYNKLSQQLPGVIESLKTILKEIESLGKNTTVNKIYYMDGWV